MVSTSQIGITEMLLELGEWKHQTKKKKPALFALAFN